MTNEQIRERIEQAATVHGYRFERALYECLLAIVDRLPDEPEPAVVTKPGKIEDELREMGIVAEIEMPHPQPSTPGERARKAASELRNRLTGEVILDISLIGAAIQREIDAAVKARDEAWKLELMNMSLPSIDEIAARIRSAGDAAAREGEQHGKV